MKGKITEKGISAVIVSIMLLMIAVSLVGVAYVFIMGFQEQAKSEVQQSGTEAFKNIGSCLQTVSFDGKTNNLYVKNCGRYPIENVTVFIDKKPVSSISINAKPNEIKNIMIFASVGIHEIKLVSAYASAAISVNVTAAPVCSDGTLYGQCSTSKPLYCGAEALVNKCSACGCSSGGTCRTDGSCTGGYEANIWFSSFSWRGSGGVYEVVIGMPPIGGMGNGGGYEVMLNAL